MTPNDPRTDDLTGVLPPVAHDAPEDMTDVVAPVRRSTRDRGAAEPAAEDRTEVLTPISAADQAPTGDVARRGRFGWGKLTGSSPAVVEPRNDVLEFDPFEPVALATLEAKHVSAWFDHGRAKVLEDVSLTIPAGEVYAFIGPSGCGKSTFLRILNRMHEEIRGAEMSGEVLLDGWDIYDTSRKLTEARANIGMVFQRPNPFPAMSIYDNVIAGLRLTGARVSRSEKDDIVERSLTSAGLWREAKDRLRSPGGGLSGGQQQRLCIARSLAIKPKVLLMDEPCSALDPHSTQVIEDTMIELQKEVTIVIVTHNMQQAQRVSSNTAFFFADTAKREPGFIVESGPTETMFSAPQNERTQDYVGGRFG